MGDTANKIQDLLYQQAERLGTELGGLLDSAKETEALRGLLDSYNERVETLRTAVTGNENAQQVFDSIAKAYEAILTLVETALNSDAGKNLVEQLNQLKDDYITGAKDAAEEEASS